jgi:hypothetical protein
MLRAAGCAVGNRLPRDQSNHQTTKKSTDIRDSGISTSTRASRASSNGVRYAEQSTAFDSEQSTAFDSEQSTAFDSEQSTAFDSEQSTAFDSEQSTAFDSHLGDSANPVISRLGVRPQAGSAGLLRAYARGSAARPEQQVRLGSQQHHGEREPIASIQSPATGP